MSLKNLIIFLMVMALSGCATKFKAESDDFGKWHLPFEPNEVVQLLKGSYEDKQFVFQVALSLQKDRLSLIGLDTMGRRAFTVKWDDNGVHGEKAPWIPSELKGEHILYDLMLAYWPIDALKQSSDIIIEAQDKRLITRNGKKHVTISRLNGPERWQGRLVIENHHRSYRIEVQSQEIQRVK